MPVSRQARLTSLLQNPISVISNEVRVRGFNLPKKKDFSPDKSHRRQPNNYDFQPKLA